MPGEMLPECKSIIMRVTSLRLDWGDGQQLLGWRKNALIKFIIMNSIFIHIYGTQPYLSICLSTCLSIGARQVT